MSRRQIYLPKSLYPQLQLSAQQRNQSVFEMVRKLLDEALRQELANPRSTGESLLQRPSDITCLSSLAIQGGDLKEAAESQFRGPILSWFKAKPSGVLRLAFRLP